MICVHTGASPSVVSDAVASPIEQQIVGVEKMLPMSSQCTDDGSYTLSIGFDLGPNLADGSSPTEDSAEPESILQQLCPNIFSGRS